MAKSRQKTELKAVQPLKEVGPAPEQLREPSFPFYPVLVAGQTYKLCFEFSEMIRAEQEILLEGWKVNLLFALDVANLTLEKVRCVFGCAIRSYHPGVRYEDAIRLVDLGSMYGIATAILTAFADAKDRHSGGAPADAALNHQAAS